MGIGVRRGGIERVVWVGGGWTWSVKGERTYDTENYKMDGG